MYSIADSRCLIVEGTQHRPAPGWLEQQPVPVIAWGAPTTEADVITDNEEQAQSLARRVEGYPLASLVLVQTLRAVAALPDQQALTLESLAYATLQGGPEFARWQQGYRDGDTAAVDEGEPIVLTREDNVLVAQLNRAGQRNAMTVEMRDAWVEMLRLLEADTSLEQLELSARGACFSTGGALGEFGSRPDVATAHWVRTVQSPARMMARFQNRVRVTVHGACIGSGIEVPAFAHYLRARPGSYFQLPELTLGLIPGAGGTVSMTRRIGRQRVAWMVLSGRRIDAATALNWGLIDEITEAAPAATAHQSY